MKYFVTSRLSDNMSETPEGFLLCLGVPIARTGEMVYGPGESPVEVGPDGFARISRDAKEVFRPETIASFEGKPFTIKHPEEFVNPTNYGVLAKGTTLNVRKGTGEYADHIIADILITDAEAIKLVKGGIREVSCGYECEYVQTGIGVGFQSKIVGNHVALVEEGRAGTAYINDQQGAKMSKLSEKIKGIFAKAGDEAAKVVDNSGDDGGGGDKAEEVPKWAKKFMATVQDAMTQVASMSQPSKMADEDKDDDKKAKDADGDKDKDKSKDAEEDMPAWAQAICKRLDALEGSTSDEDKDDDDKDKSEDEEEMMDEEGEESEDDDFEETPAGSTHDEASRVEILAPGAKFSGKDAKRKALMKAYEAKDSKTVIMNLNGGKAIDLKKASQKTIDHLFVGASEVVSLYRTKDFSKWKQVRDSQSNEFGASEGMSPEKINEINAKHYAKEGAR